MQYRWDAETYSQLELPHLRWGDDLLSRYSFRGDESVLEIGCGTGRDTEKLAQNVPQGRVLAIDTSDPMLDSARARIGTRYPNIEFLHGDVQNSIANADSMSLAFSVATFHWVPDHRQAFANVADALSPSGVLLVDCGGKGNIDSIIEIVRSILGPSEADGIWNFADAASTEENLSVSGFEVRDVHLIAEPARFDSKEMFHSFLATLVLGAHMSMIEQDFRQEFVDAVVSGLPDMTVDYVRLKIDAIRL